MSDSQHKTIEVFQRLTDANALVHAYRVARSVGITNALREGQKSAAQLAESLSLALRPTQLLLEQLIEVGFIEKYGEDYALSVIGKMLPDEFADLGDRYLQDYENWIRTGESGQLEADLPFHQTRFGVEAMAFEWMSTPNAMDLIQILNIGQSRSGIKVIDLGCGSGIFGSALGYHDPKMKLVFVDNSSQLARCKSTAESVQIVDRSKFIEADPLFYSSQLPVDLLLVTDLCYRLSDKELASVFQNAAKSLKKDGEIAVVERFSSEKSAAFNNRTFAIQTELRTAEGKLRTRQELTQMLYAAGFCDAMYSNLKSPPATHGVIVAGRK